MCRATTCSTCKKPTWAGCGAHVEQVLGHVPPADRCHCRETKVADKAAARAAAKQAAASETGDRGGFVSRLLGR